MYKKKQSISRKNVFPTTLKPYYSKTRQRILPLRNVNSKVKLGELGRLNKWATDSCSEIKRHISQAEKSVLKKEQLLWWKAMLKKAGPICDNISQLLVTAESFLEGVSTRLVSAKERKKRQQRSRTESTFRKQSAKKRMIRKFFRQ